jgi:hypothetical protein
MARRGFPDFRVVGGGLDFHSVLKIVRLGRYRLIEKPSGFIDLMDDGLEAGYLERM